LDGEYIENKLTYKFKDHVQITREKDSKENTYGSELYEEIKEEQI
jgi:hypothetical protein